MDKINMNVKEVMADMRQNGMKISQKKFNLMVDAGLLPFVKVLAIGECGKRTQVIRRRDYEAWRNKELEAVT
jgi:hypothetical protein